MKPFEDILMDEILPQQPPFRFVDTLLYCDQKDADVAFTVGAGHMLMDGEELCAAGVMEHMAQACAARNGYYAKYILHIDVSVGFIGQVKKYVINRLPRRGERLTTHVAIIQDFFKVSMADVEVKSGEEVIASATLKLAQAE